MQLLWQDETKFATLFTKKEQNQSGSVPKAAVDRNRTGTGITTHGILSPGRLPVPPLRHMDGDGFEPSSLGYEPSKDPLLYPAVGMTRFERAMSWSQTRRIAKLSYIPI